jgi:hypothetical protein
MNTGIKCKKMTLTLKCQGSLSKIKIYLFSFSDDFQITSHQRKFAISIEKKKIFGFYFFRSDPGWMTRKK